MDYIGPIAAALVTTIGSIFAYRRLAKLDRLGIGDQRKDLDDLREDLISTLKERLALSEQEVLVQRTLAEKRLARVHELENHVDELNAALADQAIRARKTEP